MSLKEERKKIEVNLIPYSKARNPIDTPHKSGKEAWSMFIINSE